MNIDYLQQQLAKAEARMDFIDHFQPSAPIKIAVNQSYWQARKALERAQR